MAAPADRHPGSVLCLLLRCRTPRAQARAVSRKTPGGRAVVGRGAHRPPRTLATGGAIMSSGLPTVHNAAKVEVTPPRVSASLRGAGSPRMAVFCHPKSVETTHVLGGGKLRSFAVTGSN